ncbi:MAG: lipopolysaccharide biosynthesis protein [Acetobacteraceae bacterium]|nr:lipopolysaccharide biosynthesis protein [Acetobacteraceae bacterium]
MSPSELKLKTFHSVLWTTLRIGFGSALTFGVFAVLARVLTPAAFGLYALAGLVLEVGRVLSMAGIEDAVTQARQLDEELASTIFWVNAALGVLVGASMWMLAPVYARIIGEPEVAPVLKYLSALIPLASLGNVHMARRLREFGHRSLAVRTVASTMLGGLAGIGAALSGWGVWSLVVQATLVELSGLCFAWTAFPWRPRLHVSFARMREISGFSASITLALLLRMLLARVQDLIIGGWLPPAAVGTYRVAWRFHELISQVTLFPIMTVSLVTLSRLQDDRTAFSNAYGRMLGITSIVTIPAMLGFGVLAGDLVVPVFGAQWAASVPIAQILSLMSVPFVLGYFVGPTLAAAGRSRASVQVAAAQLAATVIVSLAAVRFGVEAVAAGYVIRGYAMIPYQIGVLKRETGIGGAIVCRNMLPPLAASLLMAAAMVALRPAIEGVVSMAALRVALELLVGTVAYGGGLLLLAPRFVRSSLLAVRSVAAPFGRLSRAENA